MGFQKELDFPLNPGGLARVGRTYDNEVSLSRNT